MIQDMPGILDELQAKPLAAPQACPERAKRVERIPPLVRYALSVGMTELGVRSGRKDGTAKKLSFRAKPQAESRNLWGKAAGNNVPAATQWIPPLARYARSVEMT